MPLHDPFEVGVFMSDHHEESATPAPDPRVVAKRTGNEFAAFDLRAFANEPHGVARRPEGIGIVRCSKALLILSFPVESAGVRHSRFIGTGQEVLSTFSHSAACPYASRSVSDRARKRTRRRANGCASHLRATERELAGEPLTPDAGRQEASARARRLHELRREFRFAGLTKQIGMALAVIPQVRFGVHGSLLPSSKT